MLFRSVPVGYWRSVGESYNIFAVESAIDELALASNQSPVAFRQNILQAPGKAVLNAALGLITTTLPTGSARGYACMFGFGSILAAAVEISLDSLGKIKVNKVWVAIDCGKVINPYLVETQIQSGVAQGVSSAMWGQVLLSKGVVNVSNFNAYPSVKLANMPTVVVKTIDTGAISGTTGVGGVGETAVPLMAPAIANAYAALKGNASRMRTLPFYPGTTMGGL